MECQPHAVHSGLAAPPGIIHAWAGIVRAGDRGCHHEVFSLKTCTDGAEDDRQQVRRGICPEGSAPAPGLDLLNLG
jgi:hypothetical protein